MREFNFDDSIMNTPDWLWDQSARETIYDDMVDEYEILDRIEALNPQVNAIVSLRPRDELLAEARAVDATSGGPLAGLPIAVKDLVATKGLRTTWGSPLFADFIPAADDLVAARLRAAGYVELDERDAVHALARRWDCHAQREAESREHSWRRHGRRPTISSSRSLLVAVKTEL